MTAAQLTRASQVSTFLAPRVTVVGAGTTAALADHLPAQVAAVVSGGSPPHAVVVVDDTVDQLGLHTNAVNSLEAAGLEVTVVSCGLGEPSVENAERVLAKVLDSRAGLVVGIGGGSVLDVSKAVALAAGLGMGVREAMAASPTGPDTSLPLVLAPTTAGTGAEVTRISMLSSAGAKVIGSSPKMVPDTVVLDPDLLIGLPPKVTAFTGADALAHAVESYLSTARSVLTTEASLTAIGTIREALPAAVANPQDLDARLATLMGSYQAGLALNAGVVLGHSMAYTIANRAHLPHGITTGMCLPYCVLYNAGEIDATDGALLAAAITGTRGASLADAAAAIQDLVRGFGLPTSLAEVGITAEQVEEMARECVERYPRPANPRPFDVDSLVDLYRLLFSGSLS